MKKIGKAFKIIVNTILALLILLGVAVIFSFIPFPGNYKIFTVQSGSMEPTIHTGSLIFVKPMDDYRVGDVITRKTNDPKVTITHRIFSKEEDGAQVKFETKGDANNGPDNEKFPASSVIGKELLAIPFIGYPVSYAKTTQGLILLIIIPAVIIIYDEAQKIRAEIEKKIDYRRRVKKRLALSNSGKDSPVEQDSTGEENSNNNDDKKEEKV